MIPLNGQPGRSDMSSSLESLYGRIMNTADDLEKIRLNDSVRLLIEEYAGSDSVLKHRFDNIRYLGQVESPDRKIKIITWNLPLRDGRNKYFLYIIKKGKGRNMNQVYKLTGENRTEPVRSDTTYTCSDWYGALYYTILPFKIKGETSYILLGLDTDNISVSRKIIDILTFTEEGLIFGKACFLREGETKFREILEYAADGLVSLRPGNKKLIIFDHLDTFSTGHGNNSLSYGAAGLSFDGYIFKNGKWEFVSDLDVRNIK